MKKIYIYGLGNYKKYVDECLKKLKSNSNLDMCLDIMLIKMWEELIK